MTRRSRVQIPPPLLEPGCPERGHFPAHHTLHDASGRSTGSQLHNKTCITTTSSHRPNLRPISRSVPTSSKPGGAVQRDRRLVAADDPSDDCVETVGGRQAKEFLQQRLAGSLTLAVTAHVDRVLDAGAVRGRSRYGDSEPKPTTSPASSATRTACAPDWAESHTCCSASDRGTRSNVTVDSATSTL